MTTKAYINNIAAFLPNAPVDNTRVEAVLGQVSGRPSRARKPVLKSTQITSRHYAIDPSTGATTHTNAQLTAEAVRRLASKGFALDAIDLLVCGTTLPDQLLPNHGLMVHGELGNPPCEVVATAGICLSGVMALKYGYLSILGGESRNVVATGSENASSIMRGSNFTEDLEARTNLLRTNPELAFEKDFLRWILSDGAGAVWMRPTPNRTGPSLRVDWIFQKSYASETEVCMYGGGEKQANGSFRGWREFRPHEWLERSIFAVKQDIKLLNEQISLFTVERPVRELVERGRLDPAGIDYFLPHYSSEFFRDKVAAGMKAAGCPIPEGKWFTNLHTKGNTGSASIYIILAELFHSGRLRAGETLLCFIPESGRFSTAFMHLTVV